MSQRADTMNDGDDEEAKHDTLPAAAPPPENLTGGSNQEPSAEEAGTKDEFEQEFSPSDRRRGLL